MKILDRYIGRSILISIAIALLLLLVLLGFFSLIDELDEAGKGNYGVADVFLYSTLMLPRWAYEVSPLAVLLGSLVGLGGLANHSELIAMRAAGVSLGRIIFSAMKAGVIAMLVLFFIGEILAPKAEQYAERMRAEKIAKQISLQTRYGFWSRDGRSFINIRQVLPGARLKDIFIYEFSEDRQLQMATHAESAVYQDNHWLLKNISQSRISPDQISSRKIKNATWESILSPDVLDVVIVRPEVLPVWELYDYIRFMKANGQEVIRSEVAFWSKVMAPLTTLTMVFLAVPFVFGMLRSVGVGQRVFAGAMLGVVFFLLSRVFGHLSIVYGINALFATSFPMLLFLGVAVWFMRRVR